MKHSRTALIIITLLGALAIWHWLRRGLSQINGSLEMNQRSNMKNYWEPRFALGSVQPAQADLVAKLGGLPWGFPARRWPVCGVCGHALAHLAQLPHVEEIFDLGQPDHVLHLFHCEFDGTCSTWDNSAGSSAWVIISRSELGEGLTQPPSSARVVGEYWIDSWQKRFTPPAILDHLEAWNDQNDFFQLGEAFTDEVFSVRTKAGGIPYWTAHGPSGFPDPPFVYLAQFGTHVHCDGPVPTPDEARTTIRYNRSQEDGGHIYLKPEAKTRGEARHLLQVESGSDGFYGSWANLGSDGTGFLYIDRSADPVQIVWFWNR